MLIQATVRNNKVKVYLKHDIIWEVSSIPGEIGTKIITLLQQPQGYVSYEVIENAESIAMQVNQACASASSTLS